MQRRAAVLCMLLVALAAPGVAAEDGALAIDSARYSGGSNQHGALTALFVANVPPASNALEAPTEPDPASPLLELQAKRMQAVAITRESVTLSGLGSVQDPTRQPESTWFDLENVQVSTLENQLVFQIHVLAQDEALSFHGRSQSGNYQPLESIYVNSGRFEEDPLVGTEYGEKDPESEVFWAAHYPGPFVGHDDEAGSIDMTLRGDFVLEVFGLTVEARQGNDAVTLASGTFDTALAGPAPASRQATTLLRLFVEDGTLRLATQGGLPAIAWVGPTLTAVQDGPTVLEGARGDLRSGDELVRLDGESYLLPAGNLLALAPANPGLSAAVQPAFQPAAASTHPLGDVSPTVLAVAAVLSLAIAVTLGALRRWSGPADLPRIEHALSNGAYLRAARLAARLLRKAPEQEDARLARAIALSRAGKPERVIGELTAHLARNDPSDGSLHYVLGLALLDAGRDDAARATLAEAVRRTPSLAGDVQVRLKPVAAPDAPSPLPREAHGYA